MAPLSDEWFVLRFLKDWTADDVRTAIRKDVDLAQLMLRHPRESGFLRKIAGRHNPSSVTVGDVLYWLSVRRPDLYRAVVEAEGGRGVEWIAKNIEGLRRILSPNI